MINQRGPVIHKNANPSPRGNHLISSCPFYGNHKTPRLGSAGGPPGDGRGPALYSQGQSSRAGSLEPEGQLRECGQTLSPLGLDFLTREMGRTVLAPHTCCEHKMEALGLRLAGGGHPGVVGSSPPSHLCHRQGSVAHLAGTPTQPSPSWASSGMMMALPPARHSVGGSDTKMLGGLADAAGPVLTHDTRMPAVQRQGASPPGGTSKCAVHEKGAAEWLGYRQSQKLSKF